MCFSGEAETVPASRELSLSLPVALAWMQAITLFTTAVR